MIDSGTPVIQKIMLFTDIVPALPGAEITDDLNFGSWRSPRWIDKIPDAG